VSSVTMNGGKNVYDSKNGAVGGQLHT